MKGALSSTSCFQSPSKSPKPREPDRSESSSFRGSSDNSSLGSFRFLSFFFSFLSWCLSFFFFFFSFLETWRRLGVASVRPAGAELDAGSAAPCQGGTLQQKCRQLNIKPYRSRPYLKIKLTYAAMCVPIWDIRCRSAAFRNS